MSEVKYGEPFLLVTYDGRLDGNLSSGEDLAATWPLDYEPHAVSSMLESVRDHGGSERLYVCIPIGRVWNEDPSVLVNKEFAETQIERMARAAEAMGGR